MGPVFSSDGGLVTSILCGLFMEFWELRGPAGFSGCCCGWSWLLDFWRAAQLSRAKSCRWAICYSATCLSWLVLNRFVEELSYALEMFNCCSFKSVLGLTSGLKSFRSSTSWCGLWCLSFIRPCLASQISCLNSCCIKPLCALCSKFVFIFNLNSL